MSKGCNRNNIKRHEWIDDSYNENGLYMKKFAPVAFISLELLCPIILSSLVFTVYMKTLYPSIAGGDSGELVAEACQLGIPHPPGYPLYTMLLYLVIKYLPIQATPAWKANSFSAFCDTIACVLIYYCILKWVKERGTQSQTNCHVAAFTAAVLYGLSPLIWTYAIGAEVFALNNLFAAALLLLLISYIDEDCEIKRYHKALAGSVLSGLALCNQHTIVLFEIPIILYVLWTRRYTLWGKEVLCLSFAFLLGLLPYIYLPIAAIYNRHQGSWGDLTSAQGFFHHLLRADYGTFRLFSTNDVTEDLYTRLKFYAVDISEREIPFKLAAVLLPIGIFVSFTKHGLQYNTKWPIWSSVNIKGMLFAIIFGFYMLVFHSLANLPLNEGLTYGVHMRFWQQPNVIIFIWIGLALTKILEVFQTMPVILRLVLRIICLGLICVQIYTWYDICDQKQSLFIRNYARALLQPLPKNAVFVVNFDLQWTSLRYLHRCEMQRSDITILNMSLMTYKWFNSKHVDYKLSFPGGRLVPYGDSGGFSFAKLIQTNPNRQFFFAGKLTFNDKDFQNGFQMIPYGLVDEIVHKDKAENFDRYKLKKWHKREKAIFYKINSKYLPSLPDNTAKYDDTTWEWTISRDIAMKKLSWATHLLDKTIAEAPQDIQLLTEATFAMEHSVQYEPKQFWNAAATLKNLGLAYAQIVKSSQRFDENPHIKFYNSEVGADISNQQDMHARAGSRMLKIWSRWLKLPESKKDSGYTSIKGVVEKFENAYSNASNSSKKQEMKKKKKTKTKSRNSQ